MSPTGPELPTHVEQTVSAIRQVHAQHRRRAPPIQRAISNVTARIGRPIFVAVLTCIIVGWIALNLALLASGRRPPDPPPFTYLSEAVSLAALYLAAMILATQMHDDELASHRDQLTLQLAILSEQKSAKIIRLLEQIRRNDPVQGDDPDAEAEAMAIPADPQAMLEKLQALNASSE